MSVFGSIMSRIFGHKQANATPAAGDPSGAAQAQPGSAGMAPGATAPVTDDTPKPSAAQAPGVTAPPVPGTAPMASGAAGAAPSPNVGQQQAVDVEAVLSELAAGQGQKLNWRQSIVDLMKLLGLDSSLENRKELARELNYSGDMNDSASMNIWLHKQVMQKLAENGGKVPEDLKS